jgi:hypothetical protein
MNAAEISALAKAAGFSGPALPIAVAVALAESGGRPDAVGDVGIQTSVWGPSIGLWQIRSLKDKAGTGDPRDATRLKDPAFNARSAFAISGGGTNFAPWTTFKTGAYKAHLGSAGSSVLTDAAGTAASAAGGVLGAVSDPIGTVAKLFGLGNLAKDALIVGLTLVFTVAALGLIALGLSRLTGISAGEAFDKASTAAATAGKLSVVA